MTSFCVHLNKLQSGFKGISFSSYHKDRKGSSRIIGADCVAKTPRIKTITLEALRKEIEEKELPLVVENFPNTNLFKIKLK